MPICIKSYARVGDGDEGAEVAWIADDDWGLRSQLTELARWIADNSERMSSGDYAVDIGFSPGEAAAGGGVVTVETMRVMAAKGMELYLSEYPPVAPSAATSD